MITVLDASAAVEVVLQRKGAESVGKILEDSSMVIAPTLFVSEVTNVFWKYYEFEDLPQDKCTLGIERCLALPDRLAEDESLWREAFAMSCLTSRPSYDMLYLVLARRYDAVLATMDARLVKVCQKHSVKTI